jgi:hypothetical protein
VEALQPWLAQFVTPPQSPLIKEAFWCHVADAVAKKVKSAIEKRQSEPTRA